MQNTANNNSGKNSVKLRFIDSYKFLNTNLDKLMSFLNKDKLRLLQREFSTLSAENFDFLDFFDEKMYFRTSTSIAWTSCRTLAYRRTNRFTVP